VQLLQVALPVLYALAAALYGFAFATPDERVAKLRRALVVSVVLAHGAWFALRVAQTGDTPLVGPWPTVSAVVYSAVLFWLLVAREERNAGSGGVVLGVAALVQLLASGLAPVEMPPDAPRGALSIVHGLTSVVAAAGLAVSGLHGALWLVLYREMRGRRFGATFGQLPDLETCARMMRRAALFGFLDYASPEVLGSLVVWLYFGAIAFSARIPGFGSRRAAIAASAGFVALAASLLLVFAPWSMHGAR
jgi:ABC-type uncharacterized transport system permease subunit